jgi:hypothetical protein
VKNAGPLTREQTKRIYYDCNAEFKEVYTHLDNMPNASKTICEALTEALSALENFTCILSYKDHASNPLNLLKIIKLYYIYLALAKLYNNIHHDYEDLQKTLSELMKVFNVTDQKKLFDEMFGSNVDHKAKWSELLKKGIVCECDFMPDVYKPIQELYKRSHGGENSNTRSNKRYTNTNTIRVIFIRSHTHI